MPFLEELSPDLVFLVIDGRYDSCRQYGQRGALIHEYMVKHGFVAAAVIRKSFETFHYAFVNPTSSRFHDVLERVTSVPGVVYIDLRERMAGEDIRVYVPASELVP
jgi:hypothetical protein